MNSHVTIVLTIITVFMLVFYITAKYCYAKNKEYDKAISENKELKEINAEMDNLRENYNKGCFLREEIKIANEEATYFPVSHCLPTIEKLKVEFLNISNDYYRFEKLRDKKYKIIQEIKERIYKC